MADVITRFKLETTQFDSKLRDSAKSLADLTGKLMIAGKDFDRFASKNVEAAKALGNIAPSATNAKDKVKELVTAYNDVAKAYEKLTEEQKKTDYGKALAGSLSQLKGKVTDAKQELYGLGDAMEKSKNAGIDFNSVLASLGQRFGINSELMGVLTSGTLATTAAVTAGAAAVAAATKMWADYNDELNRQTNVTTVTTGMKGDDAENLTIGVRALAKTYDVDFRDAINAANTLIQQFGVSGEQALSLLQDGMQGMIAGDGGKLLSMIQQYAPSFRDAGIEASQLVAIIQNSEGGLFTDQNMNAIVMGIKNIRLMTKQTSDALKQVGVDGEEMSRKLEDGSMTIFEALRQVSGAIDNVDSGSKATGEVMQAVFGRQGTMAGTKLGEAIATLNTNLEETKTQTGELGESFVRLNEANMRLENTMKEVFGMTGWEDMNNLIKTDLANTLSDVIGFLGDIKTSITDIGTADGFKSLCDVLDSLVIPKLTGVTTMMKNIKAFMDGLNGNSGGGLSEGNGQIGGGVAGLISSGKAKGFTVTTDSNGKVIGATRDGQDVLKEYLAIIAKHAPNQTATTPNVRVGGKAAPSWAPIAMKDLGMVSLGRSVNNVQADISKAQKAYNSAEDAAGRAAAQTMLDKRNAELAGIRNEGTPFADAYAHDFEKDIRKNRKEQEKREKDNEEKDNDYLKDMTAGINGMVSGVSQMVGGLEQLGIDLPKGFTDVLGGMQVIANILTAIQTISAAAAILPFAGGGIVGKAALGMVVPGNSFSGDNLRLPVNGSRDMIGVNSGEVILNQAQTNAVASALSAGSAMSNLHLSATIHGEDIILAVNNTNMRKGKGEFVTTKSR